MTGLIGWLRALALLFLSRRAPRQTRHGVALIVLTAPEHAEMFFERLGAALDLIATVAPQKLGRLARNMPRCMLIAGGGDVFWAPLRSYLVDAPTMSRRSVADQAASLIHEATHARLYARGIHSTQRNRSRVEHLCVKEELRFLERIPGTESLREAKRGALLKPWWTEAELYDRRIVQLKAHGVPSWGVSLYRFLRRRPS